MNVIVLQHIKVEDPGYIKDLMIKENCNLTTIELDEGEKIPKNLDKYESIYNQNIKKIIQERLSISSNMPFIFDPDSWSFGRGEVFF